MEASPIALDGVDDAPGEPHLEPTDSPENAGDDAEHNPEPTIWGEVGGIPTLGTRPRYVSDESLATNASANMGRSSPHLQPIERALVQSRLERALVLILLQKEERSPCKRSTGSVGLFPVLETGGS